LSFAIAPTVSLFSSVTEETVLFSFSRPNNLTNERCSPQWSVSNRINRAILSETFVFPPPIEQQFKADRESLKITSSAIGGGTFIAGIAFLGLYFALHRRHKSPQIEQQTVNEFDLETERRNEEESDDEKENIFDFKDEREELNSEELFDSESENENWVCSRIRGGNEFRMDFDGEESFSSPLFPELPRREM
jgi:hypothetical protein